MSDRRTRELIKVSRERMAEGHETSAIWWMLLAVIAQNASVGEDDEIEETLRVFGWKPWLTGGPHGA